MGLVTGGWDSGTEAKSQARVRNYAKGHRQSQESGQGSAPGIGVRVGVSGVNQKSESKSELRSVPGGSGIVLPWQLARDLHHCLDTSWYAPKVYVGPRS